MEYKITATAHCSGDAIHLLIFRDSTFSKKETEYIIPIEFFDYYNKLKELADFLPTIKKVELYREKDESDTEKIKNNTSDSPF